MHGSLLLLLVPASLVHALAPAPGDPPCLVGFQLVGAACELGPVHQNGNATLARRGLPKAQDMW